MRPPDRFGVLWSVLLFGLPALALWAATTRLIPALVAAGVEPHLAWFAAGSTIFVPFFVLAIVGAALATGSWAPAAILDHLRVRWPTAAEWRLGLIALAVTVAAMAALQVFGAAVWPRLPPHPPFMEVKPLRPGQFYILLLWLPFFFFNIVGEELWWRGFIQPRQEPVFGRATWIVQAVLHGLFHVSFGPGVLFVVIPVLFSIPWAVQRSRNTSLGIVIHAGVNGPGFLLVSLGLLPV